MFTQQYGVEVSSYVILDEACDIGAAVYDDHVELNFGSHNAFGLVLTEGMVDKLGEELAGAQRRLRELDRQAVAPTE